MPVAPEITFIPRPGVARRRLAIRLLLVLCAGAGLTPRLSAQHITIRVLEAHSGQPVNHEPLDVWTGKGRIINSPARHFPSPTYWTNSKGDAIIPYHAGDDGLSLVDWHDIPCEPHPPTDPHLNFSLQKIIEHGAVADNVCGKARAVPEPGVLVVFVKHRPWWQIGEATPTRLGPRDGQPAESRRWSEGVEPVNFWSDRPTERRTARG